MPVDLFYPFKMIPKAAKKTEDFSKNTNEITDLAKMFDNSVRAIKKRFGTGITLTNNEIEDIIKVINYLENRGILLKETIRKITSQEGAFLNFLKPLMTACLPLIKSVLTPLAKSVFLPLGLSAGMSTAHAAYQKKIYGSGTTALIISNEEMEDIVKTVKSFEESGLLIKGISETIKNQTKEQKGRLLSMLLGKLAATLLGSALRGRGVIADEGTIRAGENF